MGLTPLGDCSGIKDTALAVPSNALAREGLKVLYLKVLIVVLVASYVLYM